MAEHHDRACELVLGRLESTLGSVLPDGPLAAPVQELLTGVRATFKATDPRDVLCVHLPLIFAAPVEQLMPDDDLVGVAAACTALYTGARLLDDLMDGHDVSYFETTQSAVDVLRWATCLSIAPPLILSRLQTAATVRIGVIEQMSSTMATMASGQLGDSISGAGIIPTPEQAMAAIAGKSGALIAAFAACAAGTAGHDEHDVAQAARFGQSLGVGRQLLNDRTKMNSPSDRRSDRTAPTYAVALHAASLTGRARSAFVNLVDQADDDPDKRAELRERLASSDVLTQTQFMAEFEFSNALAAVEAMDLSSDVAHALRALVTSSSVLPGDVHFGLT